MQTFMPYSDFELSAKALDHARLNKQRVEAKQILLVVSGVSTAWAHHPAVKMWMGHAAGLAEYGYAMCAEWIDRGGNDHVGLCDWFARQTKDGEPLPDWIDNEALTRSHQSNLLRKEYDMVLQDRTYVPIEGIAFEPGTHYRDQFSVPSLLPYLWPLRVNGYWEFYLSGASHKRADYLNLPTDVGYDPATRLVTL